MLAQIKHKLSALSGLKGRLEEMQSYLRNVLDGNLPVNNQVRQTACTLERLDGDNGD